MQRQKHVQPAGTCGTAERYFCRAWAGRPRTTLHCDASTTLGLDFFALAITLQVHWSSQSRGPAFAAPRHQPR